MLDQEILRKNDGEAEFISRFDIEHMEGSFDEFDVDGNRRKEISTDLPDPDTNIDKKLLYTKIEEFLLSLDHEADRFIFIDIWKSCQEDKKPMPSVNIAKELNKRGFKISPQRVGQRQKNLMMKARKFFAVHQN
jgi:hypothetical protein